jgi:phospholipid/cholesterol/gamma-HCH transport system permease protein
VLTTIGNIIGIFGGFLISTERLGFNPTFYIESSIRFIEISDIYSSLIKAAVFGMIISTMGCYFGFKASKGALGVGKATTDAVVFSSILILAFNYFLTELLFRT